MAKESGLENLELVKTPAPSDIIIDIRHPDEALDAPLVLPSNRIIALPFTSWSKNCPAIKTTRQRLFFYSIAKRHYGKIHAHHLNQEHAGRFAVLMN